MQDYFLAALPNNRFAVLTKDHQLLIYSDSLLQFRQPLPFKADSARIFFQKDYCMC